MLLLDGDAVRASTDRSLGFSRADIVENGRRVIGLCDQARESYDFILVSLITPLEVVRDLARRRLRPKFVEVYVATSVETCRQRDTKGLYEKQARGEIDDLIGVSAGTPFEIPHKPDLVLATEGHTAEECVSKIVAALPDWTADSP